jgi:hypothetical protein
MSKNDTRRDEVLLAFHEACEHPTAETIAEWTGRYPEFADDIIAHAEHQLAWQARLDLHDREPDEADVNRNWSWTLDAMYKAQNAQQPGSDAAAETFSQLIEQQGLTIPSLARKLDIDRLVIGELNAGRMRLPIHDRLSDALANALGRSKEVLQSVLVRTLATPALGNAKAEMTPVVHRQSYEEVVLSSEMSTEKKNYWLGRDSPWTPGGISG